MARRNAGTGSTSTVTTYLVILPRGVTGSADANWNKSIVETATVTNTDFGTALVVAETVAIVGRPRVRTDAITLWYLQAVP